ncbi:hypothetical protein ACJDT4_13565 [Clostridium neuense]|uniref:Teneurin NHL domain-containing protein n=1 Tax=Clostridium neuense TaxID=1728934 RepID=A0ABW8TG85_9CLOT
MNKSRVSLKVTALMTNLFFVASSLILPFNKNVHAATTPVNVPITRVAGIVGKQVQSGYSGDNGLATNAQLSFLLNGVAMDRDGNAYIADNGSYRIRKVDALTGNITTIAGNGTSGDTGDGGLAINAQITGVSGIALDSKNNIYFTEGLSSNKVRKIDAITGNISTIAGKVQSGYAGDGTSAINAQFSDPIGIAIDKADNIYIADNFNNRVRKIDAQTGNISTVAGNGTNARAGDNGPATSASFKNVMDVAVDKDFNIYIADSNGHSIRKVAAATGNIYTIAGTGTAGDTGNDGPATSATLQNPNSVKIDDSGNIYISDCVNNKIKKVDATTQKITTIGGTGLNAYGGDDGLAINADIGRPSILALDHSGNVYVPSNCLIRKIDVSTGIISRFAGSVVDAPYGGYRGDNGASINAALNYPQGVATDKQNNIYIADTNNNRVRKIDAATGNISTIAGNGTQAYGGDGGSAVNAKLNYPSGVAVDNEGNLYIADFYNNAIRKVDAVTGNISTIAGNGYVTGGYSGDGGLAVNAKLYQPSAVAVDNDNNIYSRY